MYVYTHVDFILKVKKTCINVYNHTNICRNSTCLDLCDSVCYKKITTLVILSVIGLSKQSMSNNIAQSLKTH
jgi:hypothetical protein